MKLTPQLLKLLLQKAEEADIELPIGGKSLVLAGLSIVTSSVTATVSNVTYANLPCPAINGPLGASGSAAIGFSFVPFITGVAASSNTGINLFQASVSGPTQIGQSILYNNVASVQSVGSCFCMGILNYNAGPFIACAVTNSGSCTFNASATTPIISGALII